MNSAIKELFSDSQAIKFYRLSYKVFSKKGSQQAIKEEVTKMPDELLFHSIKVSMENIKTGSTELAYLSLCHLSWLIQADVTMFRADDLMDFVAQFPQHYQYCIIDSHIMTAFHIVKNYLE